MPTTVAFVRSKVPFWLGWFRWFGRLPAGGVELIPTTLEEGHSDGWNKSRVALYIDCTTNSHR